KKRRIEGPLPPLIRRLSEIRRANRSLQFVDNVSFLTTANDPVIAYAKQSTADTLIVAVNLDPFAPREALVTIPPELDLPSSFTVQDLLSGETYAWQTGGNYVRL